MKKFRVILISLFVSVILTGCIPGTDTYTNNEAGFFWGIWHGWLAPISLIISIFKHDISIYEVNNTGFWYDLGFYAAVISGFGSFSLSRKKRKKRRD